jgi:hypothetical protein
MLDDYLTAASNITHARDGVNPQNSQKSVFCQNFDTTKTKRDLLPRKCAAGLAADHP